jgi:mannose-6-phosphate isomerase-like protein (cupin superfamily)
MGRNGGVIITRLKPGVNENVRSNMKFSLNRALQIVFLVLTIPVSVAAQSTSAQRGPSEAIRPFVVLTNQSLTELEQKLQPDNKAEDLIGGAGMQLRVAIQHEKNKTGAAAELHDASDDVYYVLDGSATLVLGGKLDIPKEIEPGEWRSPNIAGGRTVEIRKGDLVIVPRGTPHQRSTANKDFMMILIKVYLEPLKPPAAKPAAATQQKS